MLAQLFNYFDANRAFYQNALSIEGQNAFERHFIHRPQLINRIIQILLAPITLRYPPTTKPFYRFLSTH